MYERACQKPASAKGGRQRDALTYIDRYYANARAVLIGYGDRAALPNKVRPSLAY
jgi:hypothetical protein